MNSFFQDAPTITWLFGERFIMDHARRSVIPERLADASLFFQYVTTCQPEHDVADDMSTVQPQRIHPLTTKTLVLYVDGIYIGIGMGASFDLLDIERIETHKGPQGTLFARSTIGGAVHITTEKPTPDYTGSFKAAAAAGRDDDRSLRGSSNIRCWARRS